MGNSKINTRMKTGLSGLAVSGAVVAAVLAGPAATASADPGLPLTIPDSSTSQVADDGCTFSSVGGSCSDPGPVGNAVIAFKQWLKSMGYGTGSSSLSAYFF